MSGVFVEFFDDKILRVAPLAKGKSKVMAHDFKDFAAA